MTQQRMEIARTLGLLEGLLARKALPARTASSAAALAERLRRPVRVGIFGLPRSGKTQVLNGLAGEILLPSGLPLTPIELDYHDHSHIVITQDDGLQYPFDGSLEQALCSGAPVFVQMHAPLAMLLHTSLLLVPAEPEEMDAALCWGTGRCDIFIWCTRHWSETDATLWRRGPDSLRDHALLVSTGPERVGPEVMIPAPEDGFGEMFAVPDPEDAGGAAFCHLRRRLRHIITDARREDTDAAQVFLQRHAPDLLVAPKPTQRCVTRPLEMPQPEPPVPDLARTALSRVFLAIRQHAADLLPLLASDHRPGASDADILDALEATFDTLMSLADDEEALADTWPALHETICEANELAVLLRIEGGADQACEAAALLLQLRQECEWELAA